MIGGYGGFGLVGGEGVGVGVMVGWKVDVRYRRFFGGSE